MWQRESPAVQRAKAVFGQPLNSCTAYRLCKIQKATSDMSHDRQRSTRAQAWNQSNISRWHTGQVAFCSAHRCAQSRWKRWLHGNRIGPGGKTVSSSSFCRLVTGVID